MLNKKWPHGGDWKSFEDAAGRPPLDFSANISPLGVPDKVQQAIQEAAGQADTYPDPFCRELTRAFSKAHAVPKEQILFGNGAADLIYRIVLALRPKHALLPVPCFSEYRSALALAGCSISTLLLKEENDFHLPEDFPEMIPEETDIIFLCEPGNPAGVVNPLPLLLRTAEKCRQLGTVLVVDECFLDFLPDADSRSLLPYLDHFPNLIILGAFTKLYGMAGVRLGWCLCGDPQIPDRLRQAGPPWNVSSLAQAAGLAALECGDYVDRLLALTEQERSKLINALQELGLKVIPGRANYLLFKGPQDLDRETARQGILIRSCRNYPGLGETWYRTAVRSPQENRQLIRTLTDILAAAD